MKIIVGAKDIVNKAYSAYLNLLPQEAPLEFAKNRLARLKLATRTLEFWLTFGAYAIPLAFLLYVLYWNFLPFGYDKTFTINVGAAGDTDSSQEFYLQPSRDLSDRMTNASGTPYRTLNGIAYAVFQPKAVLKNAKITVSVESDPPGSVQIIPPHIDFDPDSVKWDYDWDFTQNKSLGDFGLTGTAFPFDGCMYFNGHTQLEFINSQKMFESGPFTVYTEWRPDQQMNGAQQIIGHFNWEIWQERNDIRFQVGRMNNANGDIYALTYRIPNSKEFFNRTHNLLAIYSPSNTGKGYMELFVDGGYVGRTEFGTDKIWSEYGGKQDLTLGWSSHDYGQNPYFNGCIYKATIVNRALSFEHSNEGIVEKIDTPLIVPISTTIPSNFITITITAQK